jgi:hypothetical protein
MYPICSASFVLDLCHATTQFFLKGGGGPFPRKGGPNFFRASMNAQNDFAMRI